MHAPVQISIHGHATYHHIANLEMHTHTHRTRLACAYVLFDVKQYMSAECTCCICTHVLIHRQVHCLRLQPQLQYFI